ncbi:MAG TPA: hypothetical protein VLH37_06755, partial [Bacteroidales bacterium]|nr:hypothetical protein [Bacteroidales bacterium]
KNTNMRTIISFLVLSILLSLTAPLAMGQQDIQAKMRQDIVSIKEGRFTAQEFMLLTYHDESTIQVKISASAPVDVMSRDFFVSFFSSNSILMLIAMLDEAGDEIPAIREIDELIGDPDITINFVMTRNGVQTQVITFDTRENYTLSWDEVLGF